MARGSAHTNERIRLKAKPQYKPNQVAPTEGVYVAIDSSGEVLSLGVRRRKGQDLPELVTSDGEPVGYIRIGEVETTAKAA
jgi:hypothetical protein